MKTTLKGIWSATATLADGSRKRYFYAWKSGPRLLDASGVPIDRRDHPHLPTAFFEARKTRHNETPGVVQNLITAYKATAEFTSLSPRTRADYDNLLDLISQEFGTMPLAALPVNRTRGIFKEWRDARAKASARQADYGWVVLARMFSVCKDRGLIDMNPCEKGGRLYTVDRTDRLWSLEDEAQFLGQAPAHLHLALLLALWTGQRQGDLLAMTWPQYDGKFIRLRQGKTGKRVRIPVGAPLATALDVERARRRGDRILLTKEGSQWTGDGFRVSWRKGCIKAGITAGLTFHDMRGSAVTRLSLAQCTVPEIAAITGHSLKDVETILDTHYLGRDSGLAESAVVKLEAWRK